jgi:tape measure domain-containing protein
MPEVGIYGKLTIEQQAAINQLVSGMKTATTQISSAMTDIGGKVDKSLTKPLKETHIAASKTYGYLKDIGRIVQGIFISQVLYRGILQPLQDAVRELWNFQSELESTRIGMTYFLNESIAGVEELIDKFEILAAMTPFTFEQVTDISKLLLRYGFSKQQLLPMMDIMTDVAAVYSLNSQEMENFGRALGQIMAKGRLMSEEAVRQLSQLIPMAQILREELGLSITELGDVYVDAKTGIMAILHWLSKFKGAAEELEKKTMKGLLSSIHDYLLFIGSKLLTGPFEYIKEILGPIRDRLAEIRIAVKQAGLKGLLVSIFPPEVAQTILLIIGQLKIFWKSIVEVIIALQPLGKAIMDINVRLLQAFLPAITYIAQVLVQLIGVITKITPLLYGLAGAIVALSIARTVATSVTRLRIAIQGLAVFFTTHPIAAGVIILIGALAGLALQSEYVRAKLRALFGDIASFFDIDTTLPDIDYGTEDIDMGGLEDIESGFENIGDAADDATGTFKRFLAAFDEVYQIPEQNKGTDLGLDIEDFTFPDFTLADAIQEELEDVKEELEDFLDIPWWEKALYGLIPFWRQIWDFLKGIWDKIREFFKNFKTLEPPTLEWAVIPVKEWAKQINEAFARFRTDLAEAFRRVWKEALENAIPKLATDFGLAIDTAIAWGMTRLQWGMSISNLILLKLKEAFQAVIHALPNLVSQLGFGLSFVVAIAQSLLASAWSITAIIWTNIATWIKDAFIAVTNWMAKQNDAPWLKGLVLSLAAVLVMALMGPEAATPIIQGLTKLLQGASTAPEVATAAEAAGALLAGGINTGITDAKDGLSNKLITMITGATKDSSDKAEESGKGLGVNIIEGLTKGMEEQQKTDQTALDQIVTNIKNRFMTNFGIKSPSKIFKGYGGDTMQGFINGIHDMLEKIQKKIKEVYDTVADRILELGKNALDWGKNVIEGLISGINSKIGALKDAIKAAIKAAIDAALAALDISSPSGVFEEIGNYVTAGLAQGVSQPPKYTPPKQPPRLQHGGIITSDQYVRVGEHGIHEMVQPLNEQSMRPFANMIGNIIQQTNTNKVSDAEYTLVKMRKSDLINLERQLFTVRRQESMRIAGRVV